MRRTLAKLFELPNIALKLDLASVFSVLLCYRFAAFFDFGFPLIVRDRPPPSLPSSWIASLISAASGRPPSSSSSFLICCARDESTYTSVSSRFRRFLVSWSLLTWRAAWRSGPPLSFTPLEKQRYYSMVNLPVRLTIGVPPFLPEQAIDPCYPKTELSDFSFYYLPVLVVFKTNF